MTPHEVLHLFGSKTAANVDPVAELHHRNHLVRAGEKPRVPAWLMKEVPRRGRPE